MFVGDRSRTSDRAEIAEGGGSGNGGEELATDGREDHYRPWGQLPDREQAETRDGEAEVGGPQDRTCPDGRIERREQDANDGSIDPHQRAAEDGMRPQGVPKG